MGRKSNYSNDMFKQMLEMTERLSVTETELKKYKRELAVSEKAIQSMNNTIQKQDEIIKELTEKTQEQEAQIQRLEKENTVLRDDNERMKRILNNNSNNSSKPPSSDQKKSSSAAEDETSVKPANTYNSRKKSDRKKGAQQGHKGKTLTRDVVEEKIRKGEFQLKTIDIGSGTGKYIVRYLLDLDISVTATQIRIYADENGKYQIPEQYRTDVTYGPNIRAIAAMLYSEGVMSNDRICEFVNSISGDSLSVSEGTIYAMCRQFSELCIPEEQKIEEDIRNSEIVCTDATTVSLDGKQVYIRNMSNARSVVYCPFQNKTIESMKRWDLLSGYAGILEHDHETAMYHFGVDHAECNVHLTRYLTKNTEETGNTWSEELALFLIGLDHYRNAEIKRGRCAFTQEQIERYECRFDEILEKGELQNKLTKGRYAKKEEKALLKRLKKYKKNHLLFLHNFAVPFSDNMSERDLRKCKNRQKMSGGFRHIEGMKMYCTILGFIETVKRRGQNIFKSISALFEGRSVIA